MTSPEISVTHLDPTHVDSFESTAITAGNGYFRLWLCEAHLLQDSYFPGNCRPVFHSMVEFQPPSADVLPSRLQLPYVANLHGLDTTQDASTITTRIPYAITPTLPFHGGVVEVTASILSLPPGHAEDPLLAAMEELSKLLQPSPFTQASLLGGPLAKGIQALRGLCGRAEPPGLLKDFGFDSKLDSGYFVVIAAPADEVRTDNLWVDGDRLYTRHALHGMRPLREHSFMLFRMDVQPVRDDWDSLPSIQPLLSEAKRLETSDPAQYNAYVQAALVAAWNSPDLLSGDRKRAVQTIRNKYETFTERSMGQASPQPETQKVQSPSQTRINKCPHTRISPYHAWFHSALHTAQDTSEFAKLVKEFQSVTEPVTSSVMFAAPLAPNSAPYIPALATFSLRSIP